MTISRVKPANWAVNERLTSAQMNTLDTSLATALDKTSAGDTLAGAITLNTAGRFIPSVTIGANADTTYNVGSFTELRVTSAVVANRIYTLGATGVATNDTLLLWCEPTFVNEITVRDQAAATLITLGNLSTSDGQWAEFIYIGGWRIKVSPLLKLRSKTFVSSGTWVAPANITSIIVQGAGGGGSGGGGGGGSSVNPGNDGGSGGGGSGAQAYMRSVTVVPSTSYTVTIAAASVGGTGTAVNGGAGGAGNVGGNATFGSLITFPGGVAGVFGSAPGASNGVNGGLGTTQIAGGAAGTGVGAGGGSGWVGSQGGNTGTKGISGVNGIVGAAGTLGAGGGGGGGGRGDRGGGEVASNGAAGGAGGTGAIVVYW